MGIITIKFKKPLLHTKANSLKRKIQKILKQHGLPLEIYENYVLAENKKPIKELFITLIGSGGQFFKQIVDSPEKRDLEASALQYHLKANNLPHGSLFMSFDHTYISRITFHNVAYGSEEAKEIISIFKKFKGVMMFVPHGKKLAILVEGPKQLATMYKTIIKYHLIFTAYDAVQLTVAQVRTPTKEILLCHEQAKLKRVS